MCTRSSTTPARDCSVASMLAESLRRDRWRLADRWRVLIDERDKRNPPRHPSTAMVDAMPVLIDGIAWHLEHPDAQLGPDTPAVQTAIELGTLRHAQGSEAKDILEEYALLASLLFQHVGQKLSEVDAPSAGSAAFACGRQLFHAITSIEIATTGHFLSLSAASVAKREQRLQAFNRAVSHEIKNRVGTMLNAGETLVESTSLSDKDRRVAAIVARHAHEMATTVDNLLVLARTEDTPAVHRRANLRDVVTRVLRYVQASASDAGVDVSIDGELPNVDVDDGVVRLSLTNYLCNAIKYSNPAEARRVVQVSAAVESSAEAPETVVIRVRDNGLGVPAEKRRHLFERFFRAHTDRTLTGTGLGLSVVRAIVDAIGGRAWAEFPKKGSVFSFAVPIGSGHGK